MATHATDAASGRISARPAASGTQAVVADLRSARARHAASSPTRPFVLLAWAQSADGYIAAAPGVQTQISCAEAGALTHELRAACDAILVGVGTVLADNPRLNTRLRGRPVSGRPVAVVLDSCLRTPPDAAVVTARAAEEVPVLVYCCRDRVLSGGGDAKWRARHVQRVGTPVRNASADGATPSPSSHHLDLGAVLDDLQARGVGSVMVEGGSQVLNSFLRAGLCDYTVVTIAPVFLGGGVRSFHGHRAAASRPPPLADARWQQIGSDIVLRGAVVKRS
jgi:diaminohydroxyphosphoribosylaminopyrimidine deaminase / 5-amino-6-(5-phosphoribosylamino)uracil reductase